MPVVSSPVKKWTFREVEITPEFKELQNAMNFDEVLTKLLWTRGVRDFEAARRFFRSSLDHLHNPFLMKDMEKVVDRLIKAINNGEGILIYGDYDVDGTTAVSLLSQFLGQYTDHVATYIPDRYKEGYGLSNDGILFASDNGMSVIVALDCGIKAFPQAELALEHGIDLIIGDHHTPAEELPKAFAILDPKRADCSYPYDELSGCGIAFKICQALNERWGKPLDDLIPSLDLLVVSIGADIVPITGENRILAKAGLEVLNRKGRPAFKLLMEAAQKSTFDIGDVVFTIGPRINAAGRISHADSAIKLLTSTNEPQAKLVLNEVNEFNTERRSLDQSTTIEALKMLESDSDCQASSVVYSEDWHKGVIGIVASRLIEKHYRPTIVFTKSGDVIAGSARSVAGFSVYNAIQACSEHLIQFGGHKYAAGLTLRVDQYPEFKRAFENYVAENISEEQQTEEILIDAELNLNHIDEQWLRRMMMMHPHGPHNDLPLFYAQPENVSNLKCIGADRTHLKFNWEGTDCIAFGFGHLREDLENTPFSIAYHIEYNEFRGIRKPQARIVDIKINS